MPQMTSRITSRPSGGDLHVPVFTLEGSMLQGLEGMARQLRAFPRQYKAALARAINRAGLGARRDAINMVKARYGLKEKYSARAFRISKARPSAPTLRLTVGGKRALHMADWNAKQGQDGVSALIRRDGPRAFVRGAFLNPGKNSAKPIVFKRQSNKRGDIKALYTTTGLEFLGNKRSVIFLQRGVEKRLLKEARRDMQYRLQKLGLAHV